MHQNKKDLMVILTSLKALEPLEQKTFAMFEKMTNALKNKEIPMPFIEGLEKIINEPGSEKLEKVLDELTRELAKRHVLLNHLNTLLLNFSEVVSNMSSIHSDINEVLNK